MIATKEQIARFLARRDVAPLVGAAIGDAIAWRAFVRFKGPESPETKAAYARMVEGLDAIVALGTEASATPEPGGGS